MSDKVKLERFFLSGTAEVGPHDGDLKDVEKYLCHLAETIENLAGDMQERGETVGELGEEVQRLEKHRKLEWQRLNDAIAGQNTGVCARIKLEQRLDELAGKVEDAQDAVCVVASQQKQAIEGLAKRIQALEAANSGREGGPDISDPHGHAVSDKPSAGEISASEQSAYVRGWDACEKTMVPRAEHDAEQRAQAWEAVADKLVETLAKFVYWDEMAFKPKEEGKQRLDEHEALKSSYAKASVDRSDDRGGE